MKVIGQLWRDAIIDVASEVATHKQDRPFRAAPIQDFQPNRRVDGYEAHLVRRRIVPRSVRLRRKQIKSNEERKRVTHSVTVEILAHKVGNEWS